MGLKVVFAPCGMGGCGITIRDDGELGITVDESGTL